MDTFPRILKGHYTLFPPLGFGKIHKISTMHPSLTISQRPHKLDCILYLMPYKIFIRSRNIGLFLFYR